MTAYECQTLLGVGTGHVRECREPAVYRDAETHGVRYSGWRHVDRTLDGDHWPVVDVYPRKPVPDQPERNDRDR